MRNKHVLVTGAAQGIGFSIAKSFALQGYTALIVDYDQEEGTRSEKELQDLGLQAKYLFCDLRCESSVEQLAQKLKSDYEALDTIVHNARNRNSQSSLGDHIVQEWDDTFAIMLKHPILLTERVVPLLQKSSNPSVISIGSTNGTFISAQSLSYHLVKSALVQATRFLACQYGPLGIRVNLLEVGIVNIPSRPKKEPETFNAALEELIPLGRAATLEEVGDSCLFLASSKATFVSGSKLSLDGGEHLKDHFEIVYSHAKERSLVSAHD